MINEAKKYLVFKVTQRLRLTNTECTRESIEALMNDEAFREASLREFLEATAA